MTAQPREIFAQVVGLDPADRSAALDRLCGADAALRAEVAALVVSHEQAEAGDFMSRPTTPVPARAITEGAGSRVGPYKILQPIGEGGFGSVFLAEQEKPVRRRVALKIIKLGMDTRQVIARFEAERQVLAMMDHPHIARVLDAGETGARPYFVMEYVVGDAITAFADAHKLSVRDRLELFAQVCSAVQHAHTKGVIHRDIKPGNVLVSMVDGRPFAKVIDFGIAKATAGPGGLTDKTLFTEHRQLIGTLEYMSPEQAEGSPDIDTRTDVYALGVLLYELLTGATPLDSKRLRHAAWDEMRRIIKEEEPLAPSQKLSRDLPSLAAVAAARRSEPDRLGALLRGELDWIAIKALDKDRARRYESPNALAADIERHLKGQAIHAAPPSRAYRVRKFVRRNKGVVIAGSAVAAMFLLGLAGTTAGLLVARYNADAATHNATLALESQASAEWSAYTANLALAQTAMDAGNWPEARERLAECPESKRGWEWRFLELMGRATLAQAIETSNAITSPDGTRIAYWISGAFEVHSEVYIYPINDTREVVVLRRLDRDEMIRTVVWSQDGSRILVTYSDDACHVYGADGTSIPVVLSAGDRPARSAAWAPDGNRILAISREGVLRVWNSGGSEQPVELPVRVPDAYVTAAQWSPDGRRIATAHSDGSVVVSDADGSDGVLVKHGDHVAIWSVAWSPDGTRLMAFANLNDEHTINILSADGAGEPRVLKAGRGSALCAAWNPDGSRVLIGLAGSEAMIVATDRSTAPLMLGGHTYGVWSVAWSNDGSRAYTGSMDGVSVWDGVTGELVGRAITEPSDDPWRVSIMPGSTLLVSNNFGYHAWAETPVAKIIAVEAWGGPDQHLGRSVYEVPAALYEASFMASLPEPPLSDREIATPDGTRRIKADGRMVRFFDAGTGRELAVFRAPARVTHLTMTADGKRLVVHHADQPARVWDIRDPEERRREMQAHWAERVPAGAYLDTLWAGSTPTHALRDAIINDPALTPLRRLVGVEMLDERAGDARSQAVDLVNQLDDATPTSLRAALIAAKVHPRVQEMAEEYLADRTATPPAPE